MADLRRIIWLASYPKSGNTWTRIFLANYLANPEAALALDEITKYSTGDAIARHYHNAAGYRIDNKDMSQVLSLRHAVLHRIVSNQADAYLVKTHNYRKTVAQVELIPPKFTRSAIYIIRNPLDLVLSSSRHSAISVEKAVSQIAHKGKVTVPSAKNVPTIEGSWSEHVKSWTAFAPYPVLVVRYEDMIADPHHSFGRMLHHLNVNIDEDRLDRAIRFSSFDELKRQEMKAGFVEKPDHAERFFAVGKSEQWKTDLPSELVETVCRDHAETMKKYRYLE